MTQIQDLSSIANVVFQGRRKKGNPNKLSDRSIKFVFPVFILFSFVCFLGVIEFCLHNGYEVKTIIKYHA